MSDAKTPTSGASRRSFLKLAGVVAAGAAASSVGCSPGTPNGDSAAAAAGSSTARSVSFDRTTLDALGDVLLPGELGADGRRAAVDSFVTWVNGYDPVAEEMHGYGYSDIRYLPSDPAPAWQAQLLGLETLARKTKQKSFAELDEATRREVVTLALPRSGGDRLPDPLRAPHVAIALLAHWASSPGARNLAMGAQVSPYTCRRLDGVTSRPLPIVGATA
ncbi:MAG: gluconate 2-dehydrogenase subunit 3 family protein [Gemmatimonadaceae bacterium]